MTRPRTASELENMLIGHLPRIWSLCRRRFASPAEAEDVAQEAVLAILTSLPTWRGEAPLEHWITRVTLNVTHQARRRWARQRRLEVSVTPQDPVPAPDPLMQNEDHRQLRDAIDELPTDLQEPLWLHYFEGLTQDAVAKVTGVSQKTVSKRLSRARESLGRQLAGSLSLPALTWQTPVEVVPESLKSTVTHLVTQHAPTALAGGAVITQGVVVMNTKLIVAGVVAAVVSFAGGQMVADRTDDIDRLQSRVRDLEAETTSVAELTHQRQTLHDQSAGLSLALVETREELRQANLKIMQLNQDLVRAREALEPQEIEGAKSVATPQIAETPDDEKIRQKIAQAMKILNDMNNGNGDNMKLGMQLVGVLHQFTDEDFREFVMLSTDSESLELREDLAVLLANSAVLNPLAMRGHLNEFMTGLTENLAAEGRYSDEFKQGIWWQLSYKEGPADAYFGAIQPLEPALKSQLIELAVADARSGDARVAGAVNFLGRTGDPKMVGIINGALQVAEDPHTITTSLLALYRIPCAESLDHMKAYLPRISNEGLQKQVQALIKGMGEMLTDAP